MLAPRNSLVLKRSGALVCAILLGFVLYACGAPQTSSHHRRPKSAKTNAPERTGTVATRATLSPGGGRSTVPTAPPSSSASPRPSTTPTATATPTPTVVDITRRSVKPISAGSSKVVYFTFDDGPSSKWTPQILAILARHKAHATFFELGTEAAAYPDLVRQVRAAGHTVGNHTYDHKSLPGLSSDDVRTEIATGPASRCLRPPYGSVNQRVREIAAEKNLAVVLWDIDPRDWAKPGVDAISNKILADVTDSSIILMHDGGGDRSQTVTALERLLTVLARRGYTFHALDC